MMTHSFNTGANYSSPPPVAFCQSTPMVILRPKAGNDKMSLVGVDYHHHDHDTVQTHINTVNNRYVNCTFFFSLFISASDNNSNKPVVALHSHHLQQQQQQQSCMTTTTQTDLSKTMAVEAPAPTNIIVTPNRRRHSPTKLARYGFHSMFLLLQQQQQQQ